MSYTAHRLIITLFAVAISVAALAVQAGQPFEAKAFKAAQESGQPVLIEIHADWCPTCRAQEPILERLSKMPGFAKLARFRVDFDQQKSAVKQFGAKYQSTLVLFKGKDEVGRSVGETDEAKIRALLAKAI